MNRTSGTITRLRDKVTAQAIPGVCQMPPPPVVRTFVPPPPPAPLPLMRYPRMDNPYATKREVAAGLDAVRTALKARLDSLKPVSTNEPDTCYQMRDRQNALVENMNALAAKNN